MLHSAVFYLINTQSFSKTHSEQRENRFIYIPIQTHPLTTESDNKIHKYPDPYCTTQVSLNLVSVVGF